MYEFKIALFDKGSQVWVILFQHNYQMILEASGSITVSAKIQYLCTLPHIKALCGFRNLCVHIGNSNTTHLNHIQLDLCA